MLGQFVVSILLLLPFKLGGKHREGGGKHMEGGRET